MIRLFCFVSTYFTADSLGTIFCIRTHNVQFSILQCCHLNWFRTDMKEMFKNCWYETWKRLFWNIHFQFLTLSLKFHLNMSTQVLGYRKWNFRRKTKKRKENLKVIFQFEERRRKSNKTKNVKLSRVEETNRHFLILLI